MSGTTVTAGKECSLFFPRGLPGLEEYRQFALVPVESNPIFVMLKAWEDPAVVLFLTDPTAFFPDYRVVLTEQDRRELKVEPADRVLVYTTVAVQEKNLTANLAAPIVINRKRGLAVQLVIMERLSQMRVPLPPPCRKPGRWVKGHKTGGGIFSETGLMERDAGANAQTR